MSENEWKTMSVEALEQRAALDAWEQYRRNAIRDGAQRRSLRKREFLAGFKAGRHSDEEAS